MQHHALVVGHEPRVPRAASRSARSSSAPAVGTAHARADDSGQRLASPAVPDPSALRVALLSYRGNPYSGGQGVYVRQLSAALTSIGHQVTVFSGQPYPQLDKGVPFVAVPSLDLYRADDPFRTPAPARVPRLDRRARVRLPLHCGVPEPLTFSLRVRRLLAGRARSFDVVHDNQCLGWGMLGLHRAGLPLVASVHHAVVIDRDLELARETRRLRAGSHCAAGTTSTTCRTRWRSAWSA